MQTQTYSETQPPSSGDIRTIPAQICPKCQGTFTAEETYKLGAWRRLLIYCPGCIAAGDREHTEDHPPKPTPDTEPATRMVEKKCQGCDVAFMATEARVAERWMPLDRYCQPCVEGINAAEAAEKKNGYAAAREREWLAVCPEYFRSEAIQKAMPADKVAQVRARIREGLGVLLVGRTGSFKTTAMYHGAVKPLIWKKAGLIVTTAMNWRQQCAEAAKACRVEDFLRPFKKAPWLFIDDIGNMNGTESTEEALFELLDYRMGKNLPVLATTQFDSATFVSRFSRITPERGEALARRLAVTTSSQPPHSPIQF